MSNLLYQLQLKVKRLDIKINQGKQRSQFHGKMINNTNLRSQTSSFSCSKIGARGSRFTIWLSCSISDSSAPPYCSKIKKKHLDLLNINNIFILVATVITVVSFWLLGASELVYMASKLSQYAKMALTTKLCRSTCS